MNLLCPMCQKMLTVSEQYAGQLMKCPLCGGTFTVPSLPAPSGPATIPFKEEPVPPPPTYTVPPPSTSAAPETKTAPPPPPPPGGYQTTFTVWFSPKVMQFVPPAVLLIILVLTFFTWVQVAPGGVPVYKQNAWYVAFGTSTDDPDLPNSKDPNVNAVLAPYKPAKDPDPKKVYSEEPGFGGLMILYLLLFIPTLVVTAACLAVDFAPVQLPPNLQQLLPWRWGVAAVLNLLLFLLLILQAAMGFSLEAKVAAAAEERAKSVAGSNPDTMKTKEAEVARGALIQSVQRKWPLDAVGGLHVIGLLFTGLTFWASQRGTLRPMPKMEVMW